MEQGTALFLKHSGSKLAGRPAELIIADTGGNPAGTRTKAQELIERDQVDMIFGPLAAFELLRSATTRHSTNARSSASPQPRT